MSIVSYPHYMIKASMLHSRQSRHPCYKIHYTLLYIKCKVTLFHFISTLLLFSASLSQQTEQLCGHLCTCTYMHTILSSSLVLHPILAPFFIIGENLILTTITLKCTNSNLLTLISVLNLQSRERGYSGGLLGFNCELAKGV